MIIPTTGIVFLFGAFVYLYLSRKFYQCFKLENNRVAKLFSYSFFLIGLNYIVSGIPCLLLVENQSIWRIISPIYFFLIGGGWMLLAYTVFSFKFQKYSKIIGILFVSVFITLSPFIFKTPHYFFVEGALDWEIESSLWFLGILIYPLIIIPLMVIFFQEARRAIDRKIKIRSLGFGLALIWILLGMITDFFLITILKLHPVYSDLNYFIVFSILAITLIFTWFSPKSKWVKKIE